MKLLFWLAIVFVVMWLMRGKKTSTASGSATRAAYRSDSTETMLQCVHCKVYFPASEAVAGVAGEIFCSDAHRLSHGTR